MSVPLDNDGDALGQLFRRYAESADPAVRDQIVAQHLYLVHTVAKKFAGMGEAFEDLVQEGTIGLLNAVDMYDLGRGIKFSTYATHLVTGHIRHYLRDRGRIIRQPAWVQELGAKITKAADALRHQLKREPTVEEIAARLDMAPEGVQEIISARERSRVASLDGPPTDDDHTSPVVDMEKIRSARYSTLQLPIEDKILLQEATGKLKELERKVVRYFFYHDLNQTEIARRMGISVNYASYLLRGALGKLRAAFDRESLPPEASSPAPPAAAEAALGSSDPVTGLPAAAYFHERVRQEIERCQRYPQHMAVMMVEVNQDAAAAEEAAALGAALRRSVRQVDLVARCGRTTFALLLPHTGREARVLGERLLASLPKAGPPQVRVAAAYAVYPADGRTAEELIRRVRRAAEAAQASGETAPVRAARRD